VNDLRARLAELARLEPPRPVVSVYLNTEWADEQQRERARIFLKNALGEARARGWADAADLDWVEATGRALIEREAHEGANGAVLFACQAGGLREVHPLRVPFEDTFVVDAKPYVRPLAGVVDDTPPSLVVFVNGESARLIALDTTGVAGEARLEADVEGRHAMGGWAALAQSRYQRHIQAHRDEHYEAVAAAVTDWTARFGARHLVLAGEERAVVALRKRLPETVAARVAGTVAGARHEAAAVLAARAAELLARVELEVDERGVDDVLAAAAEGRAAVVGVDAAVGAVNRHAVRHLYVLESFQEPGAVCEGCGTLQRGVHFRCAFCGGSTRTTELGEAMIERVLASGGAVTTVNRHETLARRGGIAARLRYAA
jgi:peptide chain release factor subunit 1